MKKLITQLFKSNILVGIVLACSVAGTLNSCTPTMGVTYQNYTPPAWAPPYDDVSSIHYYYFPDYSMYYDTWNNQFWYQDNGIWASSIGLPPMYADVDLYSSYVVLINKKYQTPWNDHSYYSRNYPPHSYDNYKNIVVDNRIVKNIAPSHELVPRAFNENNNRVTFMQKPLNEQSNEPVQHQGNESWNQPTGQSNQGSPHQGNGAWNQSNQPTTKPGNEPSQGQVNAPTGQSNQGSSHQGNGSWNQSNQPATGQNNQPTTGQGNQGSSHQGNGSWNQSNQPTTRPGNESMQGQVNAPATGQGNQGSSHQDNGSWNQSNQPTTRPGNASAPPPQNNAPVTRPDIQVKPMPPTQSQIKPQNPPQYNHVSHEVPMKSIKPFMPAATKDLNYGRGFKKH